MKNAIRNLIRRVGYDIVRWSGDPFHDLSPGQRQNLARAKKFSMTSPERIAALIHSVDYLVANKITGDIAECGVWRGGSMMAVALALLARGDTSRNLFLYDTYEGMTPPTDVDKNVDGKPAAAFLKEQAGTSREFGQWGAGVWCYASIEDVRANLLSTGYPTEKLHFVKGRVEDTIPANTPGPLALLRLDTDWYESTRHELLHLYPLLNQGGLLILDDYITWNGARKAVDEYFRAQNKTIYLHRVDGDSRLLVKT